MNPKPDYTECDTETTRAFITLFRQYGELFEFPRDTRRDSETEVRANLIKNHTEFDERSVITITSINDKPSFTKLKDAVSELGLEFETEERSGFHEEIGEYDGYLISAYAPETITADWNVPHLLVYGSLNPEIETVCEGYLSADCEFTNIRNHYVVYGESVSEETRTDLSTGIQTEDIFFADDQRDYVSHIHTADLV